MLKVGDQAPDFTLEGYLKDKFRDYNLTKDFKGRWLVLFFYPLDFTFICPTEVTGFNDKIDDFKKLSTDVVGVSVDSVYAHKKWAEELGGLVFPLLSDFHKRVSRDYNVLIEDEGVALRGTFIINPDGVIKHMTVSDNDVGRNIDEVLRTLAALQTGKLCPVNWKPGDTTLS